MIRLSHFKNLRKTISSNTVCKMDFDIISLKNYILSSLKINQTLKRSTLSEIACEDIKAIEAIFVGNEFKNFNFELYSCKPFGFGFGFIYPFADTYNKDSFSGFIPFGYKITGNKAPKLKISLGNLKSFYDYKYYLSYFDSLIKELNHNEYNQNIDELLKNFYITQNFTTIKELKDKILSNIDYNKFDFVLDKKALKNTKNQIVNVKNSFKEEKFHFSKQPQNFHYILSGLYGLFSQVVEIEEEVVKNLKDYYPLNEGCSFLKEVNERMNSCSKHFK